MYSQILVTAPILLADPLPIILLSLISILTYIIITSITLWVVGLLLTKKVPAIYLFGSPFTSVPWGLGIGGRIR